MKEYVIISVNKYNYSALLLCLTHDSVFLYMEKIENERIILSSSGTLLLDQLLVSGNNCNRYIELPFDHGMLLSSKAKNVCVGLDMRQISTDLLYEYRECVQNSILTDDQRNLLLQKKAI